MSDIYQTIKDHGRAPIIHGRDLCVASGASRWIACQGSFIHALAREATFRILAKSEKFHVWSK